MKNDNIKIWVGLLDTRHFSFITTYRSKNACRKNMRLAWKIYCERCDIENNWYEFEDAVEYEEIEFGQVLRDGFIIKENK